MKALQSSALISIYLYIYSFIYLFIFILLNYYITLHLIALSPPFGVLN